MRYVADLHLHSRYSRATSPRMTPAGLHRAALIKGVDLLGTGDFTHPAWFAELAETLEPAEPGFYRLRKAAARKAEAGLPKALRRPVRFVASAEIASIFRRGGRTRKVHSCLVAESLEAAARLNARLARLGNLASDGRPLLALDARDLLRLALDAGGIELFPAHAWTPHFSALGAKSGFDSLEEAYGDLAPHLWALETGLSSDPPMNRRLSALDRLTLVSNSDAHSPETVAREANLLEAGFDHPSLVAAIRTGRGFAGTIEFHPAEGKYHADGHRACGVTLEPAEAKARGGLCPACGKPITMGVLHRIDDLADRPPGGLPEGAPGFVRLVPLREILAEVARVRAPTDRVHREYDRLIERFGPELFILRDLPLAELDAESELLALAIGRMRDGRVTVTPGFDGEYGRVSLLTPDGDNRGRDVPGQLPLF